MQTLSQLSLLHSVYRWPASWRFAYPCQRDSLRYRFFVLLEDSLQHPNGCPHLSRNFLTTKIRVGRLARNQSTCSVEDGGSERRRPYNLQGLFYQRGGQQFDDVLSYCCSSRWREAVGLAEDAHNVVGPKDSPSGEIAIIDIASRKTRFLTSSGSTERTRVSPLWSPRGDYVYLYDRAWSALDTDIMRVSASGESGTLENLTPHEDHSLNRLADVSRDGRYVLFGSNEATGWMNVALLDTRTRARVWITRENAHHIPVSFSPDGKRIVFTRDELLSTQIFHTRHRLASDSTTHPRRRDARAVKFISGCDDVARRGDVLT